MKALFFLENFLFDNFHNTDEAMISNLKLKWVYDQISVGEFSNEITKNLCGFKDSSHKKEILDLIEYYSDMIIEIKEKKILNSFHLFNKKFNNLILIHKPAIFETSVIFQKFQFIYKNKLDINFNSIAKEYFESVKNIDMFESTFIELILQRKNMQKISKSFYLLKLLIKFFKK